MTSANIVDLIPGGKGEYLANGERSLPEIADDLRDCIEKDQRNAWRKAGNAWEARQICDDAEKAAAQGITGDNSKARFGKWVSGNFPDTDQKTVYNWYRLGMVFLPMYEQVKNWPVSGLYALAMPNMDAHRDKAMRQLLSGPKPSYKTIIELVEKLTSNLAVLANSGEVEWYTPAEYIELARHVMGSIDVDPASNPIANKTVKAAEFFTIYDDGLGKNWDGNVWLNPPYTAKKVDRFIEKLVFEVSEKRTKQAILLVNNATDTKWFSDAAANASAVCFKTGRIAFMNPQGEAVKGAAQGQVFLYFGRRVKTFLAAFGAIGWVAEVRNV